MSQVGKTVCVTGASGYIASWLVKLLLNRGYIVKATVRDPKDPKKIEHLRSLDGAQERLHLLPANLLEEGSFEAAVEGCEGVFHTASPFYHDVTDPQVELLDPAVKGTLNVLNSCAKVPSIKRVVLTSSMAAVAYNGKPRTPEVVVDETWFSDPNLCRETKAWYVLSKTLAEEAAWKFVNEKGIDMVTINPAMVIGPLLQPTLNTSTAAIAKLFGDPTKTEHLMALEGAKERLNLFKADLMDEGSFDAAIDGCEGVFHTASPVIVFSANDPQADVIDPAIKGTLSVLASCKKFSTVRRVIFTSTAGTSLFTGLTLAPDVVVDETWFSDPELCKGSDTMYYVLSKVLAEEAAWKYVKENDMDMVSINPAMVIGPMLQPTMNDSVASILNLINGTEFYPDLACPWVHVKDVVEAHIRAFEIPSANGRYILGERVLHFSDVLKILHEFYPSLKLPNKIVNVAPLPNTLYQVSNTKVQSLGIEYILTSPSK